MSTKQNIAVLVIGVACGLAPWLLDKEGVEMPHWLTTVLAYICIGSVCWALPCLFAPKAPGWLTKPRLSAITAIFIGSAMFLVEWLTLREMNPPAPYDLATEWNNYKYTTFYKRTFENQTVPLDGNWYSDCTFRNVTFLYEGSAPFQMAGTTTMGGRISIRAKDPRSEAGIEIAAIVTKVTGQAPEFTKEQPPPWLR